MNQPTAPKIKIDLTSDEVVVNRPVLRQVLHPDSDATRPPAAVACYAIVGLLADKLPPSSSVAAHATCTTSPTFPVTRTCSDAPRTSGGLQRRCAHVGIEPLT